ncbi:MAG: serine/threonine-protein kinase [Solirubrobacteraceae bacterium]|jgi:serine/threonine-protein kinase
MCAPVARLFGRDRLRDGLGVATATILGSGETLGGYRVDDVIGFGGMAIVYRAEQLSLGRRVALKVLAPQLSHDGAFRERFRREGKHAAALEHPNVVTVYDSGEADGRLYLAMRLVEGTTLAERMRASGLSADDTISVLRPIASALDAAHAVDLVHRDIKPQNILLGRDDHPYLADFGVAKGMAGGDGLTATSGFVGSINYASPEQIRGEPATAAGDTYALAAVLYECLTGQVPFPRDTEAGVMHAHLSEPPPSLPSVAANVERLDRVIARGMAKEPAERYPQAEQMLGEAAEAVAKLPRSRRHAVPSFALPAAGANGSQAAMPAPAPAGSPSQGTEILSAHERKALRPVDDRTTADRRRAPATAAVEGPSRGQPRLLATAGALAIVVAAAAVVLLSGGVSVFKARSGPLTLTYSSPWQATAAVPASAFVFDRSAIRLGRGTEQLAAGVLTRSAAIPAGAPPGLVARFGKPTGTASVRLRRRTARRYEWLRADGKRLVAFVIATASTDVAVTCAGPTLSPAVLRSCSSVAASVRLAGVTVLPPGPDAAVETALRSDLTTVSSARVNLTGLAASTLTARAAPANHIAAVERGAVSSLKRIAPPQRNIAAIDRLASSLSREAAAFSALGRAATSGNDTAYLTARQFVAAASDRVSAAAATLHTDGYQLPTLGPINVPGLPAAPTPIVPTTTITPVTTQTPSSGSGSASCYPGSLAC